MFVVYQPVGEAEPPAEEGEYYYEGECGEEVSNYVNRGLGFWSFWIGLRSFLVERLRRYFSGVVEAMAAVIAGEGILLVGDLFGVEVGAEAGRA